MPAKRVATGYPDQSARCTQPAQRRVANSPSAQEKRRRTTTTDAPAVPKYKSKMPVGLKLSWPNNVLLKPRRTTPAPTPTPTPTQSSSWQWPSGPSSAPDTSEWMLPPRTPQRPANNSWGTSSDSNWRKPPSSAPGRTAKSAKKKNGWDKDSKWIPPKMKAAAQQTPTRPRRSTARPSSYNDDWMDEAFNNWS